MPIPASCPSCSARLSAPDAAAGKRVKCPKCQALVEVPAADLGYEVVDAPPPAVARPVRPAPADDADDRPARRRPRDEDEDEEGDRLRRKPAKRKGKKAGGSPALLMVGGLIGLLVLAGGGAAVYFLVLKEDKKPATAQGTAGAGSAPRETKPPLPAGWKQFTPSAGRITVAVPTDMRQIDAPGAVRAPGVSVLVCQASQNNKVFQVWVLTPAQPPPPGPIPDEALEQMCNDLSSTAQLGRETSRTRVNVGGHNGRQMVFAGGKNAVVRITFAGQHGYLLSVVSSGPVSESDADVSAFLDSAQITG
jgi:hypothetical protein